MYCKHNSEGDGNGYIDGYGVDTPLNHHYPCKCQQTYTIRDVSIYEHNSEGYGYVDRYGVDPPINHYYPFKGHKTDTNINVSAFVNTVQKKMDMDMEMGMAMLIDKEMDMTWILPLNHHYNFRTSKPIPL